MTDKIKPVITGVTVSVDFADKEYGNGSGSFANMQARYPEAGLPLEQVDQCMLDGLDLYFNCWKTIMAGRFAVGIVTGKEFKEHMEKATLRLAKVKEYLGTPHVE